MIGLLMAIDPGPQQSGYVIMDPLTFRPVQFEKVDNESIFSALHDTRIAAVAIEKIESYGAAVSGSIFDTVFWSGRFYEVADHAGAEIYHVPRRRIKKHICGTANANDSIVKKALAQRFAPGIRNYGKGTKEKPGFFYGFRYDVWQAYALGVTVADFYRNGALVPRAVLKQIIEEGK